MAEICLAAGDNFVPVKIDENDPYVGVLQVLQCIRPYWNQENITLKTLTDGITNKLVSCQYLDSDGEKEMMLVRIYGKKTDLFIDRTAEIRNIKTLNVHGLAPEIYGIFENGLAYEYYPGNTLDIELVTSEDIWPEVASQMAKMHRVKLGSNVPQEPFIWDKIEQFLNLVPEPFTSEAKQERFVNSFGSVARLRIEYERLKSRLINTKSPVVFCHNDLLLGNVIYSIRPKDTGLTGMEVSFIDFEYAAYCYQAYDIANHFNEFVGLSIDDIDYDRYPCEELQMVWIKVYLAIFLDTRLPPVTLIKQVYKEVQLFSLLSHFMWGIWSLVQYEHSDIDFDFGRYAEIRLNRYFEMEERTFRRFN